MLYFVPRHSNRPRALHPGSPIARLEQKFLADVLVLEWPGGEQARFLFDRGSRSLARLVFSKFTAPR
jgi:hypothetical protein